MFWVLNMHAYYVDYEEDMNMENPAVNFINTILYVWLITGNITPNQPAALICTQTCVSSLLGLIS